MTGPVLLVLTGILFQTFSRETHANVHISNVDCHSTCRIMDQNRSYIQWKSFYFFKHLKVSGSDIFDAVSYAAKYSEYSNIEHTCSLISKRLSAAMLPSELEGNSTEPSKQ